MLVADAIAAARDRLTPAERRVAEVVAADPKVVAFGTVAELAARSATSGPTVLRLAAKLGFAGYGELQAAVQDQLAEALRPAVERIRQRPATDPLARTAEVEVANVHDTLAGVDRRGFDAAVAALARRRGAVLVLAGEASGGVAAAAAWELGLLRPGVDVLGGSEVRVAARLARMAPGDVVLAVELRRYERWVLDAARRAAAAGADIVALTDSVVSPLADVASHGFVVRAVGAGPFDSHVGALSLLNALVAGVASRLQASATERLDAVEQAWRAAGALVER